MSTLSEIIPTNSSFDVLSGEISDDEGDSKVVTMKETVVKKTKLGKKSKDPIVTYSDTSIDVQFLSETISDHEMELAMKDIAKIVIERNLRASASTTIRKNKSNPNGYRGIVLRFFKGEDLVFTCVIIKHFCFRCMNNNISRDKPGCSWHGGVDAPVNQKSHPLNTDGIPEKTYVLNLGEHCFIAAHYMSDSEGHFCGNIKPQDDLIKHKPCVLTNVQADESLSASEMDIIFSGLIQRNLNADVEVKAAAKADTKTPAKAFVPNDGDFPDLASTTQKKFENSYAQAAAPAAPVVLPTKFEEVTERNLIELGGNKDPEQNEDDEVSLAPSNSVHSEQESVHIQIQPNHELELVKLQHKLEMAMLQSKVTADNVARLTADLARSEDAKRRLTRENTDLRSENGGLRNALMNAHSHCQYMMHPPPQFYPMPPQEYAYHQPPVAPGLNASGYCSDVNEHCDSQCVVSENA